MPCDVMCTHQLQTIFMKVHVCQVGRGEKKIKIHALLRSVMQDFLRDIGKNKTHFWVSLVIGVNELKSQ
jgi:hypothetical protein